MAAIVVTSAAFGLTMACEDENDPDTPVTFGEEDVESVTPEEELDIAGVRFADLRGDMLLVPAGIGVEGCDAEVDPGCGEDDPELTVVYREAFLVDATEVPWADFAACVEAGACSDSPCRPRDDGDEEDHPAVCVTAEDADAFCAWADKRLPRDGEWERAARGIEGRKFPWGNDWCATCLNWSDDGAFDGSVDGYEDEAPVDSFAAGRGPYGTLNMAGNVWEWTVDAGIPGADATVRGGGYFYPDFFRLRRIPRSLPHVAALSDRRQRFRGRLHRFPLRRGPRV
ncbi:MAG: formylglycine-generating enzyme family protein [Deltaproteobacteria bacterium]|nr:formylglycine-generating enzyme family protein [Deltaproteobacteria bacterium]